MQLLRATLIAHGLRDSVTQLVQAAVVVVAVYVARLRRRGDSRCPDGLRCPSPASRQPGALAAARAAARRSRRPGAFCSGGIAAFDSFATLGNLADIGVQASFLIVVALGMTFVIFTGGIDLSVGSVFALGGVVAASPASSALGRRCSCLCSSAGRWGCSTGW